MKNFSLFVFSFNLIISASKTALLVSSPISSVHTHTNSWDQQMSIQFHQKSCSSFQPCLWRFDNHLVDTLTQEVQPCSSPCMTDLFTVTFKCLNSNLFNCLTNLPCPLEDETSKVSCNVYFNRLRLDAHGRPHNIILLCHTCGKYNMYFLSIKITSLRSFDRWRHG